MNNWIIRYAWSFFKDEGFLQPYFTITSTGRPHLEYCWLLNERLEKCGQWDRAGMPLHLKRNLEARYRLECVPLDIPASTLQVPRNPLKLER